MSGKFLLLKGYSQYCGAGAATFRVEPEPIFVVDRSRLFKAAPAASFWQVKKESLVVVTKHDFRAMYNGKCVPKKTCIFLRICY